MRGLFINHPVYYIFDIFWFDRDLSQNKGMIKGDKGQMGEGAHIFLMNISGLYF